MKGVESIADSTATFPQKLYYLMEVEDGDIVQWASHGFCFRIIDQDKFSNDIIPNYFKHTKLTSFQRQLNLYGFRRLTKGEDQGSYFHPKFQRNRKDLVSEIRRLPQKGSLMSIEEVKNAGKLLPAERFGSYKNPKHSETTYNANNEKFHPSSSMYPRFMENKQLIKDSIKNSTLSKTTSESNGPKMSKLTKNIGFGKAFPGNHGNRAVFEDPSKFNKFPIPLVENYSEPSYEQLHLNNLANPTTNSPSRAFGHIFQTQDIKSEPTDSNLLNPQTDSKNPGASFLGNQDSFTQDLGQIDLLNSNGDSGLGEIDFDRAELMELLQSCNSQDGSNVGLYENYNNINSGNQGLGNQEKTEIRKISSANFDDFMRMAAGN